ncbi:unnamed protein product [Amoebophrya sp. A120]|nr:unnamed protein product [Amoebophrya sp. A120]|eukprot:GSA120T00021478001.1
MQPFVPSEKDVAPLVSGLEMPTGDKSKATEMAAANAAAAAAATSTAVDVGQSSSSGSCTNIKTSIAATGAATSSGATTGKQQQEQGQGAQEPGNKNKGDQKDSSEQEGIPVVNIMQPGVVVPVFVPLQNLSYDSKGNALVDPQYVSNMLLNQPLTSARSTPTYAPATVPANSLAAQQFPILGTSQSQKTLKAARSRSTSTNLQPKSARNSAIMVRTASGMSNTSAAKKQQPQVVKQNAGATSTSVTASTTTGCSTTAAAAQHQNLQQQQIKTTIANKPPRPSPISQLSAATTPPPRREVPRPSPPTASTTSTVGQSPQNSGGLGLLAGGNGSATATRVQVPECPTMRDMLYKTSPAAQELMLGDHDELLSSRASAAGRMQDEPEPRRCSGASILDEVDKEVRAYQAEVVGGPQQASTSGQQSGGVRTSTTRNNANPNAPGSTRLTKPRKKQASSSMSGTTTTTSTGATPAAAAPQHYLFANPLAAQQGQWYSTSSASTPSAVPSGSSGMMYQPMYAPQQYNPMGGGYQGYTQMGAPSTPTPNGLDYSSFAAGFLKGRRVGKGKGKRFALQGLRGGGKGLNPGQEQDHDLSIATSSPANVAREAAAANSELQEPGSSPVMDDQLDVDRAALHPSTTRITNGSVRTTSTRGPRQNNAADHTTSGHWAAPRTPARSAKPFPYTSSRPPIGSRGRSDRRANYDYRGWYHFGGSNPGIPQSSGANASGGYNSQPTVRKPQQRAPKEGEEVVQRREEEVEKLKGFRPYREFVEVKTQAEARGLSVTSVDITKTACPDPSATMPRRKWKFLCEVWRRALRDWTKEVVALHPQLSQFVQQEDDSPLDNDGEDEHGNVTSTSCDVMQQLLASTGASISNNQCAVSTPTRNSSGQNQNQSNRIGSSSRSYTSRYSNRRSWSRNTCSPVVEENSADDFEDDDTSGKTPQQGAGDVSTSNTSTAASPC